MRASPRPDAAAAARPRPNRPTPLGHPTLTVVVPVAERTDDLVALYECYAPAVAAVDPSYEFLFVFDGGFVPPPAEVIALGRRDPHVRLLELARVFGETGALRTGFAEARGEIIVTLPSYFQVMPEAIPALIGPLGAGADVVAARRVQRRDGWINQAQSRAFHWLVRRLTGARFSDIACGARGLRRDAAQALVLYGDLHRFIPAIAQQQGFRVVEIPAAQHPADARTRIYRPGTYVRRGLDLLTLFFLLKFTEKPLRFFGLVGLSVAAAGVALCAVLAVQRLGGTPLANRPLLLLGALLIALGAQIAALGLIGEIVVHWQAGERRPDTVKKVVN